MSNNIKLDLGQMYRGVFNSFPDGMLLIDSSGQIQLANSQSLNLTGHTEDELVGHNIMEIFPEMTRDFIEKNSSQSAEKSNAFTISIDSVIHHQSSKKTSVSICLHRVTINGDYYLVSVQRKSSISIINESLLHRPDVDIGKFISLVGHELKNPLNAVIGFTGTLLMKLPGPLNDAQVEQLQIIKSSSLLLLSMIEDLADLAKIELGKLEASDDVFNCKDVVKSALSTISEAATIKGLYIEFCQHPVDIVIKSDKRLLSKILHKILRNAITYTDKGFVQIEIVERAIDNNKHLLIHVRDSGAGIKAEDHGKLFRPFQRIIDKNKYVDGAGLGLYLSRRIANLIKAEIMFSSEHGKGSCFTIALPLLTVDSRQAP